MPTRLHSSGASGRVVAEGVPPSSACSTQEAQLPHSNGRGGDDGDMGGGSIRAELAALLEPAIEEGWLKRPHSVAMIRGIAQSVAEGKVSEQQCLQFAAAKLDAMKPQPQRGAMSSSLKARIAQLERDLEKSRAQAAVDRRGVESVSEVLRVAHDQYRREASSVADQSVAADEQVRRTHTYSPAIRFLVQS